MKTSIRLIVVICALIASAFAQGPAYPYSVVVTYNLSTTPASLVSGYNVKRAPSSAGVCGTWTNLTLPLLGNTIKTYTDWSQSDGGTYCYAATAVGTNGNESTYDVISNSVAIPPAPPTSATVTVAGSPGHYTETFAWINPGTPLTANTIYYSRTSGGPWTKLISGSPRSSWTDNSQVAGTFYAVVTATGNELESGIGHQFAVTIP